MDLLAKQGSRTLRYKSSTKISRNMCCGSGDQDIYVFHGRVPADRVMQKAFKYGMINSDDGLELPACRRHGAMRGQGG